jgi:hypothetical protein
VAQAPRVLLIGKNIELIGTGNRRVADTTRSHISGGVTAKRLPPITLRLLLIVKSGFQ